MTVTNPSSAALTDPLDSLVVTKTDAGNAVVINAYDHALTVTQTHDHEGDVADTIDIFHRSTGDGVFVVHWGGEPPAFSGTAGGDAALNAYIPKFLDDNGDGSGTITNDHTGMKGLLVTTLAEGADSSIVVNHAANSVAVAIKNADPAFGGDGDGTATAMQIDNFSTGPGLQVVQRDGAAQAIQLDQLDQPDAQISPFEILCNWTNSRQSAKATAFQVKDDQGFVRFILDSDANTELWDVNGTRRIRLDPTATSGGVMGYIIDTAGHNRLLIYENGKLENYNASGVRQWYVDENGTLSLKGGAGFNGSGPISKPTVTGSRGANAALASLLTALASYGLITDSSS